VASTQAAALGAFLIAALAAAWDYGGVLPWTQSLIIIAAVVCLFAAAVASVRGHAIPTTALGVAACLAAIGIYGRLQSIELPAPWVERLSPASATAYRQLTDEGIDSIARYPISVSPWQSRTAALPWWLAASGVLLAAAVPRNARYQTHLWLTAIGISLAILGVLAIANILRNRYAITPPSVGHSEGFGTFVNRNNGAGLLLLGLAAGFGLTFHHRAGSEPMARRRLPRQAIAPPTNLWGTNSWIIAIAIVSFLIVAVFASRSRGALLATAVGSMLWIAIQGTGSRRRALYTVAPLAVAAALLVGWLNLFQPMIGRIESMLPSASIPTDGRLSHWPDGWRTAVAHLPSGAGLGSYAYAYLPFQKTSGPTWFQHADNLWLELFVEGGIPLAMMLLAIAAILVWKLLPRAFSLQGSRSAAAAAILALAMLGISQAFDFGLLLPPLAMISSILFGLALGELPQRAQPSSIPRLIAAAMMMALALAGIPLLKEHIAEASLDNVKRQLKALPMDRLDAEDRLVLMEQALRRAEGNLPDKALLLADVQLRQEQLAAMKSFQSRPIAPGKGKPTADQRAVFWRTTSLTSTRRRAYRLAIEANAATPRQIVNQVLFPGQHLNVWDDAWQSLQQALLQRPLDDQLRWEIAKLDWLAGGASPRLDRLRILRQRTPDSLSTVGRMAAVSGQAEIAVEAWRAALLLQRKPSTDLIEQAVRDVPIDRLDSVLPSDPESLVTACWFLVARDAARPTSALATTVKQLAVRAAEQLDSTAAVEQLPIDPDPLLRGQAALLGSDWPRAAEELQKVIDRSSSDAVAKWWVWLATAQQRSGKGDLALETVRQGRQRFPADPALKSLEASLATATSLPPR
jgi:tetratricopeptide (TPR) repeat protein